MSGYVKLEEKFFSVEIIIEQFWKKVFEIPNLFDQKYSWVEKDQFCCRAQHFNVKNKCFRSFNRFILIIVSEI